MPTPQLSGSQVVMDALEVRCFLSAVGPTALDAGELVTANVAGLFLQGTTVQPYAEWAPASIRGVTANARISDGSDPFAETGTYQFRTSATGNTYVIIGGPGVWNSDGTYVYRKLSSTKAEIVLYDSLIGLVGTQTITFTSATTASYVVIGSGGFQRGTLTFPSPFVTGSISGYVYRDVNRNGLKDSGDVGLSNRRVYIDKDGDKKFDANEKAVTTSSTGWYKLTGLVPGSYTIREVVPSGWKLTAPSSGYYKVALTWGTSAKNKNFANVRLVSPTAARLASMRLSEGSTITLSLFNVDKPIALEDTEPVWR